MIRRAWWVLPAVAAAVLVVLLMVVLPPDRTIDNLGEWLFRIAPVVLAVVAIAGFPQHPPIAVLLLIVVVVGYLGVIDTFNIIRIQDFAAAPDQGAAFPKLYQATTFINAFTVLAILFGYRLGGGSTARVLRLGFASTLVLVSGLNDLTFYYFYSWPDGAPARLTWASHIKVFIGGSAPTPGVAIAFCAVHLVLALALLVVPPWMARRRGTPTAAVPPPSSTSPTAQEPAGSAGR